MAVVDSDFRRVQDELAAMAAVVARIQEQFLQTALQAEDRTRHLQARVDELESEKLAQASEMRSMQARNAELLRVMESKKPELSKVIDARNAALRKLAHARRVIRDLVNEGKMISGSDDGIEDEGSEDSEDGSDLSSEGDSTEERSVWCPSDDEETVRPKAAAGSLHSRTISRAASEETLAVSTREHERTSDPTAERVATVVRQPVISRTTSISTRASSTTGQSVAIASPSSSFWNDMQASSTQTKWYIEYKKPPATAEICEGAFTLAYLSVQLGLDEDTMVYVASLECMEDPCWRVHLHDDVAFLYKPIILEYPTTTYLISWSKKTVNEDIEKYVTQGGAEKSKFHVFLHPVIEAQQSKGAWWYLGLHSWKCTKLESIWPQMGEKRRGRLTEELKERWNSPLDSSAIADLIEKGEIEQFCIELDSQGHEDNSLAFAREKGLQAEGLEPSE